MTAKKPAKPKKAKKTTDVHKSKKGSTAPVQYVPPTDDPAKDVQLVREFEIYALWKSLPPMLKGINARELEEKYFIDDEALHELLAIRTQAAFAEKFNLAPKTLSRWNEKLKSPDRDHFADLRQWTRMLMKSVMMSTYRAAMLKDPKANSDRKLFLQFNGWGEEINVNNKGETLTELLKKGLGIE